MEKQKRFVLVIRDQEKLWLKELAQSANMSEGMRSFCSSRVIGSRLICFPLSPFWSA